MGKTKKYSLPYWVKHGISGWNPDQSIANAVKTFKDNGEHPEFEFTGTPLELATNIYLEAFKRGSPWQGFYPTPTGLANQAAELLNIRSGMRVLDPGCGFGSLSQAVYRLGAVPIPIEYAVSVAMITRAIWDDEWFHHADFLDGFRPPRFDAVIGNPPFGNVFGHSDAALDFMNRIADLSAAGTPCSIILPNRYMDKQRPKANVAMAERYTILDQRDVPDTAFAPLTRINTTLYLLRVNETGPLHHELA